MPYAPKIRTYLLWFFALGVALVSLRFLIIGVAAGFSGVPAMAEHLPDRNIAFFFSISASPVALILGLFQFLPRLRASNPTLHRGTGRFYWLMVLGGGLAGLVVVCGALDRAGGRPG